ncbi:MAG: radical SAM protein [Lachnospiraceae bacterium]|nr:radical SAM protein [Lachnospiraceae bacterium]
MAYYVLNEGFELRGWKGLPFGLRHPNHYYTDFFPKDIYRLVYHLDGQHDIDEESLPEKEKDLLKYMVDSKIALRSEEKTHLEPYQEYKSYPAMYKNHVQWSITGRCNYNCRHCFMSAPDYKGEDITLEECIHILDELDSCGIKTLSLTGGEPLVHPDFYEILDEINKRNMQLETLYTNAALVDDKLLDELEKRRMHPVFNISFDGIDWHDWLRGEEGAEEKTIAAFKLLHKRGYGTSSSMCIHRHNIDGLRETVKLLASLGLGHLKMNVASPTGRWKNETEHFISQDEANEKIIEYLPYYVEDGMPISVQFCGLIDFNKENKRISIPFKKFGGAEGADKSFACGSVKSGMYISPKGRVLPCMTLGGTAIDPEFESILEKPLKEILTDSHYRDVCMYKMGECIEHNEECRDCKYKLACGAGCRACACGETGTDYKGIDEEACQFYKNGWYEKAMELIEKYKDSFPGDEKAEA